MKKVMILCSTFIVIMIWAGTAKVAFVHHGNQHISNNSAYVGSHNTRPGFWATIDSHIYNNVPVDIHMSGTLQISYHWLENDNSLLKGLYDSSSGKNFGIANNPFIEIVGGTFSEHIMPYADEDMNIFSLDLFKDIAKNCTNPVGTCGGFATNRPKVIWIPERTWKDFLIHDITMTYGYFDEYGYWKPPVVLLDGNTAHDWYKSDSEYEQIHQMWNNEGDEVLVAFIDWVMDENMLNTYSLQDSNGDLHKHLDWLANNANQHMVAIYGDDWEKAAGVAGWNESGPADYDSNIAYISQQSSWIEAIHVSEAAQWWGVDENPPTISIPYASYGYLQSWTGGNYDYWYDDNIKNYGKESIVTGRWDPYPTLGPSYGCGGPRSIDVNGNGIAGDYEDLWKHAVMKLRENSNIDISNASYDYLQSGSKTAGIITKLNSYINYPDDFGNSINYLGWITLLSNYYETGWHNGTSNDLEGWEKNYISHTRYAELFAKGAKWLDGLPGEFNIEKGDFDGDGYDEYAIYNNNIFFIVEPNGGKIMVLFDKNGICYIGNYMTNFEGEGEDADSGHLGLFSDGGNNKKYSFASTEKTNAYLKLTLRDNTWGTSGLTKNYILYKNSSFFTVQYDMAQSDSIYVEGSISPDLKDLFLKGDSMNFVTGTNNEKENYSGYVNNNTGYGAYFVFPQNTGTCNDLGKLDYLAYKLQYNITGPFNLSFYVGKNEPQGAASVESMLSDFKINIYPNPIKNGTVKITNILKDYDNVNIFSVSGVKVGELNKNITIIEDSGGNLIWDLTNLSGKKVTSGTYIGSIHFKDNTVKYFKISVIK